MAQILLAYGLSKEIVTIIMRLYKNTTVNFRSPDADTDYLDIVAGGLQEIYYSQPYTSLFSA